MNQALLPIVVVGMFACAGSPALASQECAPVKEDAHVCTVAYNPSNVLNVWVPLRSLVEFQFGKNEENPRIVAADRHVLEVIPDGNLLVLKPKPVVTPAWAAQPIVIHTTSDGHPKSYLIRFNLMENSDQKQGSLKVVYTYPAEAAAAAREAQKVRAAAWRARQSAIRLASAGNGTATSSPQTCNYMEQHDPDKPAPSFMPSKVCDNGTFTYLYFPGNTPVPAITMDGDDGRPMVPMQGFDSSIGAQVVQQVGKHFYLRSGDALICIWNSVTPNPAGYSTGTNTASPYLVRTLKEPTAEVGK